MGVSVILGWFRLGRLRDSRPWAAGLPILEVDPVASEAVEVLLPLAEVLLSSVPLDGDLSGALKVQKIPVRVQAGAANNGDSSGEANAAVVAEPLAHNRPTTKTISQLLRPASTEPT